MTTLAYLRVSKDTQDTKNQRLAILEFAHAERIAVDEFLELQASSRRSTKVRKVDLLLARLAPGDTLLVSELSRLGRSVGEIITPTATLLEHALLAQGFMGVSKVAFPRRLQLQNRDSTGANLSNAIKCRCRDNVGWASQKRSPLGVGVFYEREWSRDLCELWLPRGQSQKRGRLPSARRVL